ncbi:MAG: sigma-E processing peptidase SpoIIGA [Clostridium sp.]|uniref:sigma-E processing peptidase SpoIIGA n=1 Tax=Clostridium sp. TaxID=1506 RepID=UPI0025C6416C|nr:sigma-E processing peptidase SpoIIGA [Clostridium sp.]MCH3964076.1 sigma-E processing peptidase SpoIIGA [Clostridium sp.]MCI1716277.1 sigma-E processing peptidase SpoIIGA [Clostridium sp.]MCI1800483.1 sigma-E processing peptidase SpoIIGA [Clostridium sp.]MCI1814454.1 sigma-E processing peptidase SpoIIGA [Clostridium sp.]MCI1871353.1 sigma-E processing peptidase SpoIIGA [Clostridium sp.]
MIVFLDVLIFVNVVVNFFIMYITAKTLRIMVKFRYMVLSSLLGGIYVITMIFPVLSVFSRMPFKILAAAILVLITFRKRNIVFNLKALSIFVMYSMLLAGICIFIQYNIYGEYTDNFSCKWLVIAIMIAYIVIDRLVVFIRDRKTLTTLIFNVDIVLNNGSKRVKAFLDTGNELKEPATNLPVIIVEKSMLGNIDIEGYDKFYIPYKVVDGKCGRLRGFKPKAVKIGIGDNVEIREAIIAFCEDRLSEFSDYHALLPRGVI